MGKREKLLSRLVEHLSEGERILDAMIGARDTRQARTDPVQRGIFAATSHRLVFFARKRSGDLIESFPYEGISHLEHGKTFTGGTLKFRASGNVVAGTGIQPFTDLPAFVELIEDQMDAPRPVESDQISDLYGSVIAEPLASGRFIISRTWQRRLLMRLHSGWEMRRRAGSEKSVPYATLRGRWQQGGWTVAIGGSETWTLSVADPLFCEIADLSGRRVATCEWGEFLKLTDSQMELTTDVIFPNGPNFQLRINGKGGGNLWSWSEDLHYKDTLVADGSAGSFISTHHPTPAAALLLWWAVHRQATEPYRPKPSPYDYGGG